MTEMTSIDRVGRERRVFAPAVVPRPNVTTVMAQTAVGYIAANFLLILAHVLLVPAPYNFAYVFSCLRCSCLQWVWESRSGCSSGLVLKWPVLR